MRPYLGNVPIGRLDTAAVREWRASLITNGVGASEVAKAYRFLRAVLMTASDDRIIPRNPCRIRGAGEAKPDERPVLPVSKVFELADLMPDWLRALVLLATFASLRWGEVTVHEARDDALIFTGRRGGILRRSSFRRAADWGEKTEKIGFPGLEFHDLRHTGNTLAASSGASLKDLMNGWAMIQCAPQ